MQQEKSKSNLYALFSKWKTDQRMLYGLYAVLLAGALACYWLGTDRMRCAASGKAESSQSVESLNPDTLETRLSKILSQIYGAGRVEVLITYETSGEIVPAMSSRIDEDAQDTNTGGNSTMQHRSSSVSEPATVKSDGNQVPIVLVEKEPVVRGVIVVAEGASAASVRMDLMHAVQAATGVSLSRIEVFEMTKEPTE